LIKYVGQSIPAPLDLILTIDFDWRADSADAMEKSSGDGGVSK
jgi:hypothetical protein